MRTLRLLMAGAMALLLLGSMAGLVLAQEESEPSAFPTGTFVSEQNSYLLLEFREDGTGFYRDANDGWDYPFAYSVDGDHLTRPALVWPDSAWAPEAATWRWEFDGQRLEFLEPESGEAGHNVLVNTFLPIEEPRIVPVAAIDLEAGVPIREWQVQMGFVPLAEVAPKLYTDPTTFVGSVPYTQVDKGRPLTLDLMVPAE